MTDAPTEATDPVQSGVSTRGFAALIGLATVLKATPLALLVAALVDAVVKGSAAGATTDSGSIAVGAGILIVGITLLAVFVASFVRRDFKRLVAVAGVLLALDVLFLIVVSVWWTIEATNDTITDDSPAASLFLPLLNAGLQATILVRARRIHRIVSGSTNSPGPALR